MRVPSEDIETDPDHVTIEKYGGDADGWDDLESEVIEETDEMVRFEAATPGFSLFAVTQLDPEPEPDPNRNQSRSPMTGSVS